MRLRDQVAKAARPAKLYATVISTTTTNATVKLDSGAVLSNIDIIGGPVIAGDRVLVVYLDKVPYVNAPGKQQTASVTQKRPEYRGSEPAIPSRDSMTAGGWTVNQTSGIISQQQTLISPEGYVELGDLRIDGDHATHIMWEGVDPNASPFWIDNFGNIKAANFVTNGLVDGVDVSAHAANENAHHNRVHDILGQDHTGQGNELDVVGFSANDIVGKITPSSDPGASARLLKSTPQGGLTLEQLVVRNNLDIYSGDLTVGANVLLVDNSQGNVGIGGPPDPQFRLDVHGPMRAQYYVGPHALQIPDARMILHFDAAGNQYATYNASLTGHLGQVPTYSTATVGRPGKFGKAVQISQLATNLVTNPSFEKNNLGVADYTGWTIDSATTSASSSSDVAYSGDYSLKLVNSGGANISFSIYTTIATGAPLSQAAYNVSAMFYAPASLIGKTVRLLLWETGGVSAAETTAFKDVIVSEMGWQIIAVGGTILKADRTSLRLYLQTPGAAVRPGEHMYWDAIVAVNSTILRPYFDGSYGPGFSWSGQIHRSTSVMSLNSRLAYSSSVMPMPRGSLSFWVYNPPSTYNVLARYLVDTRDASNLNSLISYINTDGKLYFRPALGITLSSPSILGVGWRHIAMTYDYITDQYRLYVDGDLVSSYGA